MHSTSCFKWIPQFIPPLLLSLLLSIPTLSLFSANCHAFQQIEITHKFKKLPSPLQGKNQAFIAGIPTINDNEPGVVRFSKNRRSITFVAFQEWLQQKAALSQGEEIDQKSKKWHNRQKRHGKEKVSIAALPLGRFTEADGTIWEAGTFNHEEKRKNQHAFNKRTFLQEAAFPGKPVVFISVVSNKSQHRITPRIKAMDEISFTFSLMVKELTNNTLHLKEELAYLAIYTPNDSGSRPSTVTPTHYAPRLSPLIISGPR